MPTELKTPPPSADDMLRRAQELQRRLGGRFRDQMVETLYREAERIADRAVAIKGEKRYTFDQRIDRIVTSPVLGLPLMILLLGVVFWITIAGANVPSQLIGNGLFWIEAQAAALFDSLGVPGWLTGFLWHGVYRALAWVVSVMLPPMAIFFPMFTILEDLGYLPRVAFNLDWMFRRAGAHGKQALTMAMGFGCNAAGVVSTRIIDSPRERLIAILTNNFVPCNGRFPLLLMLGLLFVASSGSEVSASVTASFIAAGTVLGVVLIGVAMTLMVSWGLSRTILKGEASAFTLELPPYRRPSILRILYTSLIDRTMFVLWRAIIMAAPCGAVAWLLGNISAGGEPLMAHIAGFLDPVGRTIGLDGVIILAYIVAIPANEIVIPTILMGYMNTKMMTDVENMSQLKTLLVVDHHWTWITAVCLMLFSLLHNPCSTTIMTIYKETRSVKWTLIGALMPLAIAFIVCLVVATALRAIF